MYEWALQHWLLNTYNLHGYIQYVDIGTYDNNYIMFLRKVANDSIFILL